LFLFFSIKQLQEDGHTDVGVCDGGVHRGACVPEVRLGDVDQAPAAPHRSMLEDFPVDFVAVDGVAVLPVAVPFTEQEKSCVFFVLFVFNVQEESVSENKIRKRGAKLNKYINHSLHYSAETLRCGLSKYGKYFNLFCFIFFFLFFFLFKTVDFECTLSIIYAL
jgi:hypothetical protein